MKNNKKTASFLILTIALINLPLNAQKTGNKLTTGEITAIVLASTAIAAGLVLASPKIKELFRKLTNPTDSKGQQEAIEQIPQTYDSLFTEKFKSTILEHGLSPEEQPAGAIDYRSELTDVIGTARIISNEPNPSVSQLNVLSEQIAKLSAKNAPKEDWYNILTKSASEGSSLAKPEIQEHLRSSLKIMEFDPNINVIKDLALDLNPDHKFTEVQLEDLEQFIIQQAKDQIIQSGDKYYEIKNGQVSLISKVQANASETTKTTIDQFRKEIRDNKEAWEVKLDIPLPEPVIPRDIQAELAKAAQDKAEADKDPIFELPAADLSPVAAPAGADVGPGPASSEALPVGDDPVDQPADLGGLGI